MVRSKRLSAVIKIADYSKNNSIAIPLNAVQRSASGDYVFVADNNTAKKKVVKLGATSGGQIEVLNGLTNGDNYTFTVAATNSAGTGQPSQRLSGAERIAVALHP